MFYDIGCSCSGYVNISIWWLFTMISLENICKEYKLKISNKIIYFNCGVIKQSIYNQKFKTYDNFIEEIDSASGYHRVMNILKDLKEEALKLNYIQFKQFLGDNLHKS